MKKFDPVWQTLVSKRRVESTIRLAEDYKHDSEKEARLKNQQCVVCYYSVKITGQAFTEYRCEICNKEGMHNNTGIPRLCNDCANKEGLCKDCGAKINFEIVLTNN